MQTAQWILGLVDREQLSSPDNSLIEVKNFKYTKTIGKADIHDIKFCKEYDGVVIDKDSFAIYRPVSMET